MSNFITSFFFQSDNTRTVPFLSFNKCLAGKGFHLLKSQRFFGIIMSGMNMSMKRTVKTLLAPLFMLLLGQNAGWGAALSRESLNALIDKTAARHDLPATLIHAIIRAESAYDSRAVSPKGAAGLMQLMPETAQFYGVKDVFDPQDNIEGGAKYLKDLVRLYEGRRDYVLAAYNAGQEAVKKFNGVPPYPETKEYIKSIAAAYENSIIRTKVTIYQYIDDEGRLCFSTRRLK